TLRHKINPLHQRASPSCRQPFYASYSGARQARHRDCPEAGYRKGNVRTCSEENMLGRTCGERIPTSAIAPAITFRSIYHVASKLLPSDPCGITHSPKRQCQKVWKIGFRAARQTKPSAPPRLLCKGLQN